MHRLSTLQPANDNRQMEIPEWGYPGDPCYPCYSCWHCHWVERWWMAIWHSFQPPRNPS